jgi:hypothetical protein
MDLKNLYKGTETRVSHLEWIISDALRKRGGWCSTNGSFNSSTTQPTSLRIKSGCTVQAAARNYDMSGPSAEASDASKIKHDDPTTVCTASTDRVSECSRLIAGP